MARVAVVIPARYHSTRLVGKPLHLIAGVPMLCRAVWQARQALKNLEAVTLIVATDDERIADYARSMSVDVCMTSAACASGSDRVFDAVETLAAPPEIIINLQGDLMLADPEYIRALIDVMRADPNCPVATPVIQLSWPALEALRAHKVHTPFSGTTVVMNRDRQAIWFSKSIIPAIRQKNPVPERSPVYKHVGLYAYRYDVLKRFVSLEMSHYEKLEGLEQLRLLENEIPIQCVLVDAPEHPYCIGVDSLEDVARVEAVLAEYGDPIGEKIC